MAKTTSTTLKTHPKSTSNKSSNRKRSRSSNDSAPMFKKKQPTSDPHRTSGKSKSKSSSNRTAAVRDRGGSRGRSLGGRGDKRGKSAREAGSEDSADTVSEDERGRGRGRGDVEYEGSGEGEDSEEGGWSYEEEEGEGGEKEKTRCRERGRKEERVVKGRTGARGEKEDEILIIDGKPISAEQVKMMMRLMKTAAAGEGGAGLGVVKKGGEGGFVIGALGEEGEEGGDKVELEMSEEDEEEYEDMAREYRQDLEEQFRVINKSNVELVAGYKADKTIKAVTACLKRKEAEGLLKEYKAWLVADQAYKPAIKEHWSTMINAIDADTKSQVVIIRKIEVLVGERMNVVATARKAFANKSEEHKSEIEGYQLELDKSKKKSVKAYHKFTDEEAIRKDIGMKLKEAMFAYADNLMAGGKSKGSKSKNQDETDDGSEDE